MTATLSSAPVRITKPREPKAYAPTGAIGKKVLAAFSLKLEIDRLTAQFKNIKNDLKNHCQKNNLSRLDVGDVQAQFKTRNNWTYSVGLQNEMLRIEQLQRLEQTSGVAQNNPTYSVAVALSKKALD